MAMVQVTGKQFHTFVAAVMAEYGEENVVETAKQAGSDQAYMEVLVLGETRAAMHFEDEGGNSCFRFLGVSYVVEEDYLSYTRKPICLSEDYC